MSVSIVVPATILLQPQGHATCHMEECEVGMFSPLPPAWSMPESSDDRCLIRPEIQQIFIWVHIAICAFLDFPEKKSLPTKCTRCKWLKPDEDATHGHQLWRSSRQRDFTSIHSYLSSSCGKTSKQWDCHYCKREGKGEEKEMKGRL